jgi:hypothetical protein
VVANYGQMDAFFARQGKIAWHLAQPDVKLALDRGDVRVDEITVRPGDQPLLADSHAAYRDTLVVTLRRGGFPGEGDAGVA